MPSISRRGLIGKAALIGGTILLASSDEALAATVAVPAALGEKGGKDYLPTFSYEPKPLPFQPNELKGFDASAIEQHYKRDYCGAVERLQGVHASIAKLPPHTPPYLLAALKREELALHNNVALHQMYFQSLSGDGKLDKDTEALLTRSFGGVDNWRNNFLATAKAASHGGGWVSVCSSPLDDRLHNIYSPTDEIGLTAGQPLLVLDMHQHAYTEQFADVESYVDAYLSNAKWHRPTSALIANSGLI